MRVGVAVPLYNGYAHCQPRPILVHFTRPWVTKSWTGGQGPIDGSERGVRCYALRRVTAWNQTSARGPGLVGALRKKARHSTAEASFGDIQTSHWSRPPAPPLRHGCVQLSARDGPRWTIQLGERAVTETRGRNLVDRQQVEFGVGRARFVVDGVRPSPRWIARRHFAC